MPIKKLLLAISLFLLLVSPVRGQGPVNQFVYLPIIVQGESMNILKSTIAIVIPKATTNYAFNSSAEGVGFIQALAGTTLTLASGFQKYGIQGAHVETNADNEGIFWDLETLPNNAIWATIRVYGQLPPGWDWSLDDVTYTEPRLLERIDTQWNLYGVMFPAGQANGNNTLWIRQNGAGSGDFWLDGLQIEEAIEGRYYSTYCEGSQEGCRWLGAPNTSISMRSGDSRAGGVVTGFWEGFNFFPEKALGMGTAIEELNIDSYAFLPGGELNSSKIPPREFTIIGYFLADTVEELHEYAQRLELELGLNTYPGRQPIRLRYSGARVLKEISANYTGGLEGDLPIFYNDDWSQEDEAWVRNYRFKMRASIQFKALDPFWYEVGESATLLDTNDTDTFRVVAGRLLETGQWDNLGPPNAAGSYTTVYAIAEDATYIYFGGDFTNFDNIANADYIVRYEKATGTYSAMAALNGIVRAIAIAPNGDVIIGGDFTDASGVAQADYVAVWAVGAVAFTALGDPSSGGAIINNVFALFFDPTGLLWIGGTFSNWSGIANADNIVTWDGSVYAAPTVGADGGVVSFAHDGTYLYVAGAFTTIGGLPIARIAAWDGSAYSQPGDAISSGQVHSVVVWNNRVVIGQSVSPFVSILNGQLWAALGGTGVDDDVRRLAVSPDGDLFLAGNFTAAGTFTLTDRIARFNGYSFSHLDINLPGTVGVQAIYPSKIDIDPLISDIYSLYLGYDEPSGTAEFAGLVSNINEGTISAFPKIVFYRSGGTSAVIQTLRNERTGRELLFSYGLLDGESLTIDLNPKNRTIVSSFFGPRMNARLPNDDFSTWQLLPGENPVSSFVSEDGSPTVTAYVLFREPYRGWN